MKRVVQISEGFEFNNTDTRFLDGWKKYCHSVIVLKPGELPNPEIPWVCPANPISFAAKWQKSHYPHFSINRPYIGSHLSKHRTSYRISVNSFACTQIGKRTQTRWPLMNIPKEPWKVKEVKNVLIAPSRKSQYGFTNEEPTEWAQKMKDFFISQGVNAKIRPKAGKKGAQHWGDPSKGVTPLFGPDGDFEWADLVVSYSSAITAEAFWYGKKAISLGVCPTWTCCDKDLNDWRNPVEPKGREDWHEHMAWIQFTYEDFYSGLAQELTHLYQGWPTEVPHVNNF